MKRAVGCCVGLLAVIGCATAPAASIMLSPQHNLLAVGYDSDRSNAIFKTHQAAEHHCRQQGRVVQLLSEVTVYQGRFDQNVTEAAKAASDVAFNYGNLEAAQTGRAFSSDTDYRTTIEFLCG